VQGRLLELVSNGDDTLSIYTTVFDILAPEASMAARSRLLALIDYQSGWRPDDGAGELTDRNTELLQRLPAGWTPGVPGRGTITSLELP
jgi:hypothetical protein